jgi:hypothetical protein
MMSESAANFQFKDRIGLLVSFTSFRLAIRVLSHSPRRLGPPLNCRSCVRRKIGTISGYDGGAYVRWTPNSQLRLMFGAQAEMGCRVRSGFARAVDVEADVVHVGPTAGAVAPGIGPEVCHDPHLLGSAGSAHSYHFSNRARIHPSLMPHQLATSEYSSHRG